MTYPIYIPSKGRYNNCFSANLLIEEKIDFNLVVQEKEYEHYKKSFPNINIIAIPQKEIDEYLLSNLWALPFTRTWIKKYSESKNEKSHWQLDDNISGLRQVNKGKSKKCSTIFAFNHLNKFYNKYNNIGIMGLRHSAFASFQPKPIQINQQVYSFVLIKNFNNIYWRDNTIEDTDYSLQILSSNYCTVLFNIFCFQKPSTSTLTGGNTDSVYKGDGRLICARKLQRDWPGIVKKITRKRGMPRILLNNIWSKYTTKLKNNE